MNKEVVVHYSAMIKKKHKYDSVPVRWMNLDPVIQSEVKSEREKQILNINTYIGNLERWY